MSIAADAHQSATFFSSQADFRDWLAANHESATELWVAFYRKGTGQRGLGYDEAVEEALCWGWIDGLTRRRDEQTFAIRFTPRRRTSNWSESNLKRVARLMAEGRMQPAGLAAYEARRR